MMVPSTDDLQERQRVLVRGSLQGRGVHQNGRERRGGRTHRTIGGQPAGLIWHRVLLVCALASSQLGAATHGGWQTPAELAKQAKEFDCDAAKDTLKAAKQKCSDAKTDCTNTTKASKDSCKAGCASTFNSAVALCMAQDDTVRGSCKKYAGDAFSACSGGCSQADYESTECNAVAGSCDYSAEQKAKDEACR